jgi:hypothetical protein
MARFGAALGLGLQLLKIKEFMALFGFIWVFGFHLLKTKGFLGFLVICLFWLYLRRNW